MCCFIVNRIEGNHCLERVSVGGGGRGLFRDGERKGGRECNMSCVGVLMTNR